MSYKIIQNCEECHKKFTCDGGGDNLVECPECGAKQTYTQKYTCAHCQKNVKIKYLRGSNEPLAEQVCECGSTELEWQAPSCWFKFSDPEGTKRWNGSHDYRYKHNYEKAGGVKDQREAAEKASHMGPTPYTDTTEADLDLGLGTHNAPWDD